MANYGYIKAAGIPGCANNPPIGPAIPLGEVAY